jgi:hypothetical protein
MGSADLKYLKMREEQEQAAAERAACPEAQPSHEEMAARYRAMLSGAGDQTRLEGGPAFHHLWQLGARSA